MEKYDYFTMCSETESYVQIKDTVIRNLIWKNVICRFGIPMTIVEDNDPNLSLLR